MEPPSGAFFRDTLWKEKSIFCSDCLVYEKQAYQNFNDFMFPFWKQCYIYLPLFLLLPLCDWMCLPKICMLNPNTQYDSIWRWDLWDVIRSWSLHPHEWDWCPYKRELRELPGPSCHLRTQQFRWSSMNQGACSHQTQNLLAPCLDFSASRSVRSKYLLLSHSVYGIFVIEVLSRLRYPSFKLFDLSFWPPPTLSKL